MERLPYIDEHVTAISAPRDVVWASIIDTLRRTMGGSTAFARLLGCDPARVSEPFDGTVGQTLPGFRVVEAELGHRLTLEGRHRFSRYRLTFHLDEHQVRAQTEAAFPGALGRLYRAAVIGTGGHTLMTRNMLRRVRGSSDRLATMPGT